MIVLDTTVLIYAVGAEHPLREPCRALVRAIGQGSVVATTTVEVIQELTHVRARRQGRAEGVAMARSYAALLAPLLVLDETDLASGLELFLRHEPIGAFDAVLAGATIRRDAALVSADHGFAAVDGLLLHDPATADFLDRIHHGEG